MRYVLVVGIKCESKIYLSFCPVPMLPSNHHHCDSTLHSLILQIQLQLCQINFEIHFALLHRYSVTKTSYLCSYAHTEATGAQCVCVYAGHVCVQYWFLTACTSHRIALCLDWLWARVGRPNGRQIMYTYHIQIHLYK